MEPIPNTTSRKPKTTKHTRYSGTVLLVIVLHIRTVYTVAPLAVLAS